MHDLMLLSQNNPASDNFVGDGVDLASIDDDPHFQPLAKEPYKTVVFSQWTKLLDR